MSNTFFKCSAWPQCGHRNGVSGLQQALETGRPGTGRRACDGAFPPKSQSGVEGRRRAPLRGRGHEVVRLRGPAPAAWHPASSQGGVSHAAGARNRNNQATQKPSPSGVGARAADGVQEIYGCGARQSEPRGPGCARGKARRSGRYWTHTAKTTEQGRDAASSVKRGPWHYQTMG